MSYFNVNKEFCTLNLDFTVPGEVLFQCTKSFQQAWVRARIRVRAWVRAWAWVRARIRARVRA